MEFVISAAIIAATILAVPWVLGMVNIVDSSQVQFTGPAALAALASGVAAAALLMVF